jgi:hypothetical protein
LKGKMAGFANCFFCKGSKEHPLYFFCNTQNVIRNGLVNIILKEKEV